MNNYKYNYKYNTLISVDLQSIKLEYNTLIQQGRFYISYLNT